MSQATNTTDNSGDTTTPHTKTTQNENANNNVTQHTTPVIHTKLPPRQVPISILVDPTRNIAGRLILGKLDPAKQPLPFTTGELMRRAWIPLPAQLRHVMINAAIPGMTQLADVIIINADWKTTNATPKIPKLTSQTWLHNLLAHPQAPRYNTWRTEFFAAPTILNSHISIALHRFLVFFMRFVTRAKDNTTRKLVRRIQRAWQLLDWYTQNWILQLFAIHENLPTLSKINDAQFLRGTNYFYEHSIDDNTEVAAYFGKVCRFWEAAREDRYKKVQRFPHEATDEHPYTVDWDKQYPYNNFAIPGAAKPPQPWKAVPKTSTKDGLVEDVTRASAAQLVNDNNLEEIMMADDDDTSLSAGQDELLNSPKSPELSASPAAAKEAAKNTSTKTKNKTPQATKNNEQKTDKTEAETQTWHHPVGAPPAPTFGSSIQGVIVAYYDKVQELHRQADWKLEQACTHLQLGRLYDPSKYNSVYNLVHELKAGQLDTYDAIKSALTLRAPLQFAPYSRYRSAINTDPFVPYPSRVPAPQQQQPNKRPPPHSTAQNYYARLGAQLNPKPANQQNQFTNNPANAAQLHQQIQAAFAGQQLPPRGHAGRMPRDPTGVVDTPAASNIPVETRYPAEQKQQQQMYNFNNQQFQEMNAIMRPHGGIIPLALQNQHTSQSSNVNTS